MLGIEQCTDAGLLGGTPPNPAPRELSAIPLTLPWLPEVVSLCMSKTIISQLLGLGMAAFLLVGTAAWAQQQQQQQGSQSGSAQANVPHDGILMREGKVYFIKNGQPQRIERETRLSEGITVDDDGNVTLKDGRKTKLTDGQMVTLDGQLMIAPLGFGQDFGQASGYKAQPEATRGQASPQSR